MLKIYYNIYKVNNIYRTTKKQIQIGQALVLMLNLLLNLYACYEISCIKFLYVYVIIF